MIQPPLTPYKWQSSHPVTKLVVFTSLTCFHCISDNNHPTPFFPKKFALKGLKNTPLVKLTWQWLAMVPFHHDL